MDKIPTKVHNINRISSIVIDNHERNIHYIINEDYVNETTISVKLPEYKRPKLSEIIIDDSNEFVNGFKVVQTENGEYAYVRETDNCLLPYRYDVATNFNEYGFAMVGKDGFVSWIDTNFKYFNIDGNFVEEKVDKYPSFNAWQTVSEFSKGEIPLSRLFYDKNLFGKTVYLGIDGKLKEFYQYDGNINHVSNTYFSNGDEFDINGFAMADGKMLFARGYYCTYHDLIKICKEKGFILSICEDAEEQFNKNFSKILK